MEQRILSDDELQAIRQLIHGAGGNKDKGSGTIIYIGESDEK